MSLLQQKQGLAAKKSVFFLLGSCLVLGLGLVSCQPKEGRDIRDYYFPLRALNEGLVYAYEPVSDTAAGPAYWYYLTLTTDSATYLTGAYYESDFNPRQVIREEMVYNGMLLDALYLYEPDSNGLQQQVTSEVLSASVFPFFVRDDKDVFLYKVRFQMPSQPNGATTLIINRRFLGDTSIVFQGKSYDAIRFGLAGVVEVRDSIQGDMEPAFRGEEVYAHKLGLFSYRRDYGGAVLDYQLNDRFPMNKLIEMSKANQ